MDVGASNLRSEQPPVLYGRQSELEQVRGWLAAASTGQGRLVVVNGEAGVGKTTLVETVAREAQRASARVLSGSCYDLDPAPYGLWIDLLQPVGVHERPAVLAGFNLVATVASQQALFQEAGQFFEDLAGAAPLVLILEDLHWADAASLDLLRYLTRRLRQRPVLFLATYRDDDLADSPLAAALPALVRESRADRLNLRRLDQASVGQLLRDRYGLPVAAERELSGWLFALSEGNPFFVEELLRTLEHDDIVRSGPDGWQLGRLEAVRVPALVRQVIEGRLRWLSADDRTLLQIAAVIGVEVPLELWRTVAQVDAETLAGAIEQAEAARLIDELPDRSGWRFTHALIRETLYLAPTLPRRQAWHRLTAEALAARADANLDLVAHHFQRAADERAAEWLIRAGDRAMQAFASVSAAARYEQALAMLDRDGRSLRDRVQLRFELAYSYRFADPQRSLQHLNVAEALLDELDDAAEARALLRWGRVLIVGFIGRPSLEHLRDAIVAYTRLPDDTRRRMAAGRRLSTPSFGGLALCAARHGDARTAIELAERYFAEAREIGFTRDDGRALCALGIAWAGLGEPDRAREAFNRGRERARETRDFQMLGTLLNWEMMEFVLPYGVDDPAVRRQLASDASIAWEQVGMADDDSPVDMTVYALLLLDGRWDDADSSARGDIVVESLRFDGLRLLAELEHLRGHNDRATQHLYAALPDGPSSQPSNYYFYSTLRLLRLGVSMALDAEDLTLAQAWIEAHDRWVDWSGRLLDRPAGLLLWSRYQRVRGDTDAALHLAHDALTQAESPRQPLALLEAHRLLGELLTGTGEYEQAGQHLDAAATIARAAAAPYEQALTLAAQAELAQRTGDAERLNVVVSEARRICEPLGARPLLERIARLDRSSAVTPAPDDLPLSPREVEVLRLVAIGLSNAEVGERLFISPRTVAQHLQSIYNKLAISSRTAAAAFAFEHGLVDVRDVRTQG